MADEERTEMEETQDNPDVDANGEPLTEDDIEFRDAFRKALETKSSEKGALKPDDKQPAEKKEEKPAAKDEGKKEPAKKEAADDSDLSDEEREAQEAGKALMESKKEPPKKEAPPAKTEPAKQTPPADQKLPTDVKPPNFELTPEEAQTLEDYGLTKVMEKKTISAIKVLVDNGLLPSTGQVAAIADAVNRLAESMDSRVAGVTQIALETRVIAHFPDVVETLQSEDFQTWKDSSDAYKALYGSKNAADAIKLLRAYHKAQGKRELGEFDREAGKREKKVTGLLSHTAARKNKPAAGRESEEEYGSQFERFAKEAAARQ